MTIDVRIIDITGADGAIVEPEWLARAESVHRQLRPQLPAAYADKMRRVFARGARMCVAVRDGAVAGVAVYRIHENTFDGVPIYVDDLVTDEAQRSQGVGAALLAHLERTAREAGCTAFTLDSGTQRRRAHAFYFRAGLSIASFHFSKPLTDASY